MPFTYSEFPGGRPADPDLSTDSNRFMDLPVTPLYPFGHGLTYSTFRYGPLELDSETVSADGQVRASFDLTNAGDRPAEEVVQLYMRDPVATRARPRLELRGFARVALAPGETRRVTFELEPAQFALFERPGEWRVEPGTIELHVGASSADLRQSARLTVEDGAVTARPASAIETGVTVQ